jgi:hypothetical protein
MASRAGLQGVHGRVGAALLFLLCHRYSFLPYFDLLSLILWHIESDMQLFRHDNAPFTLLHTVS